MQSDGIGGVAVHVTPLLGDAGIVALARRRHGVVTTADLLDAGFGRNAIAARVDRGWLRRIHRGVYAVGALESELTALAAALAAYGPNATLSHRTAAVIWQLLPTRPADPIDITLRAANRRSRPGVTVHRARAAVTRRRHGLRLTSPAQTLADLSPQELERAYNEALVLNLTTHRELSPFLPRSRALRALLEDAPGMTRSRTAFESDRLKDAALQLTGERVLRVTGRQLEGCPEAVLVRLATAISTIRPALGPLVN